MTDLIRAYATPDKYAIDIPVDKIVCDENIDNDYVQKLAEVNVIRVYTYHRHKAPQQRTLRGLRWPSPLQSGSTKWP